MDEAAATATRVAFVSANSWAGWATIMVAAGVLIELIVLFIFSKEMDWREKAAVAIASVLIVSGVAGEWWFGGIAADASEKLEIDANAKAAAANERAANLERDAAQLRLELARLKAPRNLDPDAQKRVADTLRPLGSQPFTIGEGPMEPGSQLDTQLIDVLLAAGWTLVPPQHVMLSREPRAAMTFSDEFGVMIFFNESRRADFAAAAEALAKALNDSNVAARSKPTPATPPPGGLRQADTINILVAPKPP